MIQEGFSSIDNKGFHITFPNGTCLSSQFGYGNYCENYNSRGLLGKNEGITSSKDCEIAVFSESGDWLTKEMCEDLKIECNDDVLGQVNVDLWVKILDWCRDYK